MTLHTADLALLLAEMIVVGGVILGLFGARRHLGLGPVYLFVGALQYLQTVLAATLYLEPVSGLWVSPGSAVLFAGTVFAVLLMYLFEDIPSTRSFIVGVVVANLALTVLSVLSGWQLDHGHAANVLDTPRALFQVDPWVFGIWTVVLAVDALAVVVVFEFLGQRAPALHRLAKVALSLGVVLAFDATAFTFGAFWGQEGVVQIWISQLAGKGLAAGVYAAMAGAAFGLLRSPNFASDEREVLGILSFRERYLETLADNQRLGAELERRAELETELRRISDLKDEFVSSINHELRTPLTSIGASLKLLDAGVVGPLPEKGAELVQIASRNCDRLVRLINDVLDLQKIEAGEMPVAFERVSVSGLVARAIDDNLAFAAHHDVRLVVGSLPESDLAVDLDRDRILQVLTNLVSNAVKVSPVDAAVEIGAMSDGDGVLFEVVDSGPGIPDDLVPVLFERFSQAGGSDRVQGGTGLGLAISRGLIEQHSGAIGFDTKRGEGTRFWFTLPATQPTA